MPGRWNKDEMHTQIHTLKYKCEKHLFALCKYAFVLVATYIYTHTIICTHTVAILLTYTATLVYRQFYAIW